MADWSLPVLASAYADVLTILKTRDVDALTLCYAAPTTPPTGAIAYVRASDKFQEWSGAAWVDKVLSIAGGGTGGATAAAARATLGIGTLGTQASNAIAVTGGTITGVALNASDFTSGTLALARGGTNATLALGTIGQVLQSNGSAVVFGTDGSALTTLNATNISTGTLAVARIAALTVTQFASPNISQWTNNSGYATATSTTTFTNKSGNISQWTNDAGYVTSLGTITWASLGDLTKTIVPDVNNTYNLGSASYKMAAIHVTNIYAGLPSTTTDFCDPVVQDNTVDGRLYYKSNGAVLTSGAGHHWFSEINIEKGIVTTASVGTGASENQTAGTGFLAFSQLTIVNGIITSATVSEYGPY